MIALLPAAVVSFACRAAGMGMGHVWKICLEGAQLTYLWSLTYEGSLGST